MDFRGENGHFQVISDKSTSFVFKGLITHHVLL